MFVIMSDNKETKTMFPKKIITTITIYIPAWDTGNGNATIHRAVLKNVFVNENSISVFQQTGTQVPNHSDIFVPANPDVTGRTYVPPIKWYDKTLDELDDFWTIDLERQNHTRIVIGEPVPTFEFGTFASSRFQMPIGLANQFRDASNPTHSTFIFGLRQPRDFNDQRYDLAEHGTDFLRIRV